MAFVQGYVNGEPAEIPDNFVQLWPEVYSLTAPEQTDPTAPSATDDASQSADRDASKRKDTK
ncbi:MULTISPECIES: hypothetical protein [unclassified Microbacterium]|uniref:hypothetical protein n=1 Tax=unclassified Microbacterium TaxID=2609290 RepID=UPI003017597A